MGVYGLDLLLEHLLRVLDFAVDHEGHGIGLFHQRQRVEELLLALVLVGDLLADAAPHVHLLRLEKADELAHLQADDLGGVWLSQSTEVLIAVVAVARLDEVFLLLVELCLDVLPKSNFQD